MIQLLQLIVYQMHCQIEENSRIAWFTSTRTTTELESATTCNLRCKKRASIAQRCSLKVILLHAANRRSPVRLQVAESRFILSRVVNTIQYSGKLFSVIIARLVSCSYSPRDSVPLCRAESSASPRRNIKSRIFLLSPSTFSFLS